MDAFIREARALASFRRKAKRRSFLIGIMQTGAPKSRSMQKKARRKKFSLLTNISHSTPRSMQ